MGVWARRGPLERWGEGSRGGSAVKLGEGRVIGSYTCCLNIEFGVKFVASGKIIFGTPLVI